MKEKVIKYDDAGFDEFPGGSNHSNCRAYIFAIVIGRDRNCSGNEWDSDLVKVCYFLGG